VNQLEAPFLLAGKACQLVILKCSIACNCKSHIGALDKAGAEGVTKGVDGGEHEE
jgi:hypothetical protein